VHVVTGMHKKSEIRHFTCEKIADHDKGVTGIAARQLIITINALRAQNVHKILTIVKYHVTENSALKYLNELLNKYKIAMNPFNLYIKLLVDKAKTGLNIVGGKTVGLPTQPNYWGATAHPAPLSLRLCNYDSATQQFGIIQMMRRAFDNKLTCSFFAALCFACKVPALYGKVISVCPSVYPSVCLNDVLCGKGEL
jgi:hypothetical protein